MGSDRSEVVAGLDPVREELGLIRGITLAAAIALAANACSLEQPAAHASPGPATSTAGAVDSTLPMAEMLRRFREGLPPTATLDHAAGSRDHLVERFITALEQADLAMLRRTVVSKSEYAYLYFPTSEYARAPYELPPEIAWMLNSAASDKGLSRLVRRLAGEQLRYSGYACADSSAEGGNRFWKACAVAYADPDGTRVNRRLFGTIIERDNRFKILTYANDF